MTRDPLHILSRVRRAAVTEARRALGTAMGVETRCEASLRAARESVRREQQRTGFAEAVAFGAWLPQARAAIAQGEASLRQAVADVAQCRAALAASHAEAEAVATMLARKQQHAALTQQRQDQAALDEAGAHMRKPGSQDFQVRGIEAPRQ